MNKANEVERFKLVHNNLCGDIEDVIERLGSLDLLGGVMNLRELNLASNSLNGKLPASSFKHFRRCGVVPQSCCRMMLSYFIILHRRLRLNQSVYKIGSRLG